MIPQPAKPMVLIVDDHPANRMAFEMILEPLYPVTLASNGYQALELADRNDYAVILLDIRMPGMTGFEVAEILRQRERTRHTPIIFMSAYDQTIVQAKKGYIAGATDFLFSTIDEEFLKLKVATYAQIYLQHESFKRQIQHLQTAVRALEKLVRGRDPVDEPVQEGIHDLEDQIDELERRFGPLSG